MHELELLQAPYKIRCLRAKHKISLSMLSGYLEMSRNRLYEIERGDFKVNENISANIFATIDVLKDKEYMDRYSR